MARLEYISTAVSPVPLRFGSLLTAEVSPYSWFGITNILKFRPLLNAHGVEVEILPFFLGGARDGVGNFFTPTPEWKVDFATQDTNLTGELLGIKIVPPEVFPISSLFVSLYKNFWGSNKPDSKSRFELRHGSKTTILATSLNRVS